MPSGLSQRADPIAGTQRVAVGLSKTGLRIGFPAAWFCTVALVLLAGLSGCEDRLADAPASVTGNPNQQGEAPGESEDPATGPDQENVPEAAVPEAPEAEPSTAPIQDPPLETETASTPVADVQPPADPLGGCELCHADLEKGFMASKHYAEKVGCIKCHGPSDGHIRDENNEVLPDRLFTKEDIDECCAECHECERDTKKDPVFAADQKPVCTDCHDAHSLVPKDAKGSNTPSVE